jgi:tape measure domain-containing protein
MAELATLSRDVQKIEQETSRIIAERAQVLDEITKKQSATQVTARGTSDAERSARAKRVELETALALQQATELKPYSGPLISPASIADAQRQIDQIKRDLAKATQGTDVAIAAGKTSQYTPQQTRTSASGQREFLAPTSAWTTEQDKARQAFVDAAKALAAEAASKLPKTAKGQAEDPAALAIKSIAKGSVGDPKEISESLSSIVKNAVRVADVQDELARLSQEIEQARKDAAASFSAADRLKASDPRRKELLYDAETSVGRMQSASLDSTRARAALRTSPAAVLPPDIARQLATLLGSAGPEIRSSRPVAFKGESKLASEAEKATETLRSPEVIALRTQLASLEREIAKATGKEGSYKNPVVVDGRTQTSGPAIRDKAGRSDDQLKSEISAAAAAERLAAAAAKSAREEAGAIEQQVTEAKIAYARSIADAKAKISDAVKGIVGSIDVGQMLDGMVKEIADTMVAEFASSKPRTQEEIDRFRSEILSTGQVETGAKDSATKSGNNRKGATVVSYKEGEVPETPVVGAARIAAPAVLEQLIEKLPALRAVISDQNQQVLAAQIAERVTRTISAGGDAAASVPEDLRGLGRVSARAGASKNLVNQLEIELTDLQGIEDKTDEQIARVAEITKELNSIKKGIAGTEGTGIIDQILKILGVSPDSELGLRNRGVAGVPNALKGTTARSLFTDNRGYSREEPGAPGGIVNERIGNPLLTMLTSRIEKTGARGIELQNVQAGSADLKEFYQAVDITATNITALFAQVSQNLRGGKAIDPAVLSDLKEQIVTLLGIMSTVQNLEIDKNLPKKDIEALKNLKDAVSALAAGGGGVRAAISTLSQGSLTDASAKSILGKSPEERTAINADLSKFVLSDLIPNLDNLTKAAGLLLAVPTQKGAGSGQAEIAGVPFGGVGAKADLAQIKGIVETIVAGDSGEITKVIAEAIARNVLDPDALRTLIPGEGTYGGKPKRKDIQGLSAEPGVFDLGNATSRVDFAKIVQGIPSVMEVLGNYPALAQLIGVDPTLLEQLAAEEAKAEMDMQVLKVKLESFKKAIPRMAAGATTGSPRVYGYGSGSPDLSGLQPVTDASSLSEEQARTITPLSIPIQLQRGYTGAGRKNSRGEYGKTATGFGMPDSAGLTAEEAKVVAQDVINYLAAKGYSVSSIERGQIAGKFPIEQAVPGASGDIPDKTIITVIHKGENVADDPAVLTGLIERLKMLDTTPSTNRGVTISSYPDTDMTNGAPGYSHISAGVERPGGIAETYGAIQLAEQMRIPFKGGPMVPVPGAGAVAAHESAHMQVIGGSEASLFAKGGDMEPIHEAILNLMISFKETLDDTSAQLTPVIQQRMTALVEDFFGNIPPAVLSGGDVDQMNKYIGEYIANALAQQSGYTSGAGRGIAVGGRETFNDSTLGFLKSMLGGSYPPQPNTYAFGGPTEATGGARFNEESAATMRSVVEEFGGLTRKIVMDEAGSLKISQQEPISGYTVGGEQLENPKSGFLNYRKSEVSDEAGLTAALNAMLKENEAEIKAKIMAGVDVWLGMFNQPLKDTNGKTIEGTAFDLTSLIPLGNPATSRRQKEAAISLGKQRGQDSIGGYENGQFSMDLFQQLREQGEVQPVTMLRNASGAFKRRPGMRSTKLGPNKVYGFGAGPNDPASLDFDFSDFEDSSDTYTPVEEKPAVKEKKEKVKKAAAKAKDNLLNIVTPAEAEAAAAEALGISVEELATLTDGQVKKLEDAANRVKMAENAAKDEEQLKTAGTRAVEARKKAKARNPKERLTTPLEAQVAAGAEVGLSPDEAVKVDPSVIAKKQRDAQQAKIEELNRQDAERFAKVQQARFAREKSERDAAEAKEKEAADKKAAADAAKAKAAEDEAKKAEEAANAAKAVATPAEPTKEEYDAQLAEDLKAKKERMAAQRKARAAAKKAAIAAEQEAAAIEASATESQRVVTAEQAAVTVSKQETPVQSAGPRIPVGPPAPPSRPPAPPTPPAGGGEQPGGSSPLDAIVNQAIAAMGLGTSLPTLQALINKLNETVNTMVSGRVSNLAAAGIEADPTATRQQILNDNLGGIGKLLPFLENLASFARTIRSQGEVPTVDVSGKSMTPANASQMFGNATNLPEGLSAANMRKIAEEFDILGTEVKGFIEMARNGTLKIKQEIQTAPAATPPGGGMPPASGGASGGGGNSPWGTSGYAAPDLINIYKGERGLRDLANVYRELRPQVAHLSGDVDAASTSLQKQQRAAQETASALGAYMNVNTGILRSLKTQVGRAATFLFVQQIGREIAGVVEHLQSGVFNFNQVLENTKVGFNTLFANTLQASSSAKNSLAPAYNEVGQQVGFVREQSLSFNEALLLTNNAADGMVKKIRDIANVTPFRFQPLVEASLKMKAFGFAAQEIPGMINSISNAVAALGGEDEKIDRIAYALGQMNSAGRVYQNDMMQLANAGIAGYRMLSEKMLTDLVALKKYTMGELKDLPEYTIKEMERLQAAISSSNFSKSFGSMDQMIETLQDPRRAEGLIRAMAKRGFLLGSVAAKAITEGMDKQYQGSADRLSKTMTGALSTIADLSQNFMATAFEPLYASVRDTIVQLGQFMLKSKDIAVFVDGVRSNIKAFVDSLRGFGPVLQEIASIFINVFVGGIGSALEKGSQFGAMFGNIVDKLSTGFELVGNILNDKVGRGLAAAATLGSIFVKAIMANPMIATITLIAVAISGIADAIKTNFLGLGTVLAIFMDAIKNLITAVTDAMATIAKDVGTTALTSFIGGLTAAIVALTPFLTILLGTFSVLLKILTPFAPLLGILLGLFVAFKTATMLWNLATLAIGKPIAAIAGAWNGAAAGVKNYQEQIKLTAAMHQDLQAKKIAAGDFVKGTDGKPLLDNNGQPILNYNRATETVSSQGYPSQDAGNAATRAVNAGAQVGGVLQKIDDRLPGPLKGLLVSPRERIFGAVQPDFGAGLTLSHNDPSTGGHISTVINNEKIENRFRSLQKGGSLEAIGQQMSAAGLLNIPGLDKGKVQENANKYATAWGDNLKTLVLIEKEVSFVLSKAFSDMEQTADQYMAAVKSGDAEGAAKIIAQTKQGESSRMILPMLMKAKGDKRSVTDLTDDEVGGYLESWRSGGINLTASQARNIENLPTGVEQIAVGQVSKRIASGNSRLTGGPGGEMEQLQAAVDRGRAATALKGGSVGVFNKMVQGLQNFYNTVNSGTAKLIKNIPLLEKLQKINLGGQGTGLQQIQQMDNGKYAYVNDDGSMGPLLTKKELDARRSMRGSFGRGSRAMGAMSRFGAMGALASGASRMAGMSNIAMQTIDMIGMGDAIPQGVRQVLGQKAGLFQSLGNGIGTMLGTGLGTMVPIIGPIIGPAIGGMLGELAGNIADTIIRGSEAAIAEKKKIADANVKLGLDQKTAELAASAETKMRAARGYTGENSGGIPFIVNDNPVGDTAEQKQTYAAFKKQLEDPTLVKAFDKNGNNIIDAGQEMINAMYEINTRINAKVKKELGAGNTYTVGSAFAKTADGSYTYNDEKAIQYRETAKKYGFIEGGALGTANITPAELAALVAKSKLSANIEAGSINESDFTSMFPGMKLNANQLRNFNTTKVTNIDDTKSEAGQRMRKMLLDAGVNLANVTKNSDVGKLLTEGSNFGQVIEGLKSQKEGGAVLSDAAEKLLRFAEAMSVKSAGSFRDEFGNIRTEYLSGISQAMTFDAAQKEATKTVTGAGPDGQMGTADDITTAGKSLSEIFGAVNVGQGLGVGGGAMQYGAMFTEGLKQMKRIDPVAAMQEAGVLGAVSDLVGKSAQEIYDMWKKTTEYFDAFRKRAEALEPKVDVSATRAQLIEEFGKDLGFKLFDQMTPQRKQYQAAQKEYAGLGGEAEKLRLQNLYDLQKTTTTVQVQTGTYERDNGSKAAIYADKQFTTGDLLTSSEAGKLQSLIGLEQKINDLRYQRFKVTIQTRAKDSEDANVRKQGLIDEAALLRFRQDNNKALEAIALAKSKGLPLSREQIALDKEETALRDKLILTVDKEVSLGETLAILEKEGISISNKELLNNQALLQMLAQKAELQRISNEAGRGAIFYKQLEVQAQQVSAKMAEKQIELDFKRAQLAQELAKMNGGKGPTGGPTSVSNVYAQLDAENKDILAEIDTYKSMIESYNKQAAANPYAFTTAELDRIKALLAQSAGSMLDSSGSSSTAAAIQRNTNLLSNMATVAQKSFERVRSAQKKTHDEYIKQLDEQQKAIEERYKKRSDDQQEQSLLQQLQLAGLAMRSENADPLEAAKSFYEAKNNLAEFYIQKQKDDEVKAIEDEKARYDKQFQENSDAQEAVYSAAMDRMKNRFDAVQKILGNESIPAAQLNDMLRLTMTGNIPGMEGALSGTSGSTLFQKILGLAQGATAAGEQNLAIGENMGALQVGQFAAEGGTYSVDPNLLDGIAIQFKSSIANLLDPSNLGLRVFRGTTEESGLLATMMNEQIASSLSFYDKAGKTYSGASEIKTYLESIKPSRGFEKGAAKGYEEQGREMQAVYEYVTALITGKNTFNSTTKLAILAQRTLEQGLSDFEKATNVDINVASLTKPDITDKMLEQFIASIGQSPSSAKIDELRKLIRDTYSDVLTSIDVAEYSKFADSTDARVGKLSSTIDNVADAMTHLKDSLGSGLTTLDKILFGDTYDASRPISGFDAATEQIDTITSSIKDMQTAFEGTMSNLEAYAASLQGPIGAFHQLGLEIGNLSQLATSIQTNGIGGVQASVTTYNQVPITITVNGAQDMNANDLAAKVEEAVGRAIRSSGGSYITSNTSPLSS